MHSGVNFNLRETTMQMISGAVVMLAAAILAGAAIIRTASGSGHDYDLVPMSFIAACLAGMFGLYLILDGMRKQRDK
jgi:hypothetical protein